MDVQKIIHEQVTTHPVVLYMKGSPAMPRCGFSATAVQILQACGAGEVFAVDVLADEGIRQGIKEYANGSDIMREMYQSGELKQLIADLA